MLKTIIKLVATLALIGQVVPAHSAGADDVFIDEGGDFEMPALDSSDTAGTDDSIPVPMAEPAPDENAASDSGAVAAEEPQFEPEEPPAPVPAKETKKKAQAAAPKGREGFKVLKMDCEMHREPASSSPVLITVKGDRKLWVEEIDGSWVKGFRKKGHGYMSRECFE